MGEGAVLVVLPAGSDPKRNVYVLYLVLGVLFAVVALLYPYITLFQVITYHLLRYCHQIVKEDQIRKGSQLFGNTIQEGTVLEGSVLAGSDGKDRVVEDDHVAIPSHPTVDQIKDGNRSRRGSIESSPASPMKKKGKFNSLRGKPKEGIFGEMEAPDGYCSKILQIQKLIDENERKGIHKKPDMKSFSRGTADKALALGDYFSRHYNSWFTYLKGRRQRKEELEAMVADQKLSAEDRISLRRAHSMRESYYLRQRRVRIKVDDFQVISKIGGGGQGEVYLVRHEPSTEILALKRMHKSRFGDRNEVKRLMVERDVMKQVHTPWLVSLKYSFQDHNHLYFAMEYLPGGDVKNFLHHVGRLSEDDTRFYIAEMIMAVRDLHKEGFIHRDLKPGNFMISKTGHIKLIDYGLSKEGISGKRDMMKAHFALVADGEGSSTYRSGRSCRRRGSKVGSPEYMAVEIIMGEPYSNTVDWWSLGIITYELLYGISPFLADSPQAVFEGVKDYQEQLFFPDLTEIDEPPLSEDCIAFMRALIAPRDVRLGKKGAEELMAHPWLASIDFDHLLDMTPCFVPNLKSEVDTAYFEGAEADIPSLTDSDTVEEGDAIRRSESKDKRKSMSDARHRSTRFDRPAIGDIAGFTWHNEMEGTERAADPNALLLVKEAESKHTSKIVKFMKRGKVKRGS